MRNVVWDLKEEADALLNKVSWEVEEVAGVIGIYASFFNGLHNVTRVRVMKILDGVIVLRTDHMETLGLELKLLPSEELLNQAKTMEKYDG